MDRAIFHHQISSAGLRVVDVSSPNTSDDSPNNALLRDILSAFAGYERELISQRTRMGREARATEDGLYWGGRRPFGLFAPGLRRGRPVRRALVPTPRGACGAGNLPAVSRRTPIVAMPSTSIGITALVPTGSAHKKRAVGWRTRCDTSWRPAYAAVSLQPNLR